MGAFARWVIVLLLVCSAQQGTVGDLHIISGGERSALLALYEATGGDHWKYRDGWGGPVGSECRWYGVVCGMVVTPSARPREKVAVLNLQNNGLMGQVPTQMEALTGIEGLMLEGNAVKGPLSDALLRRFDDGQLDVEPKSLTHDIHEVLAQVSYPSLLCGDYRAQLSVNGTASLERSRCRERNGKQTREVYCERQEGHTYEFDRFARFGRGRVCEITAGA